MITQLGFSDKLGTVAYAEPQQEQFLGYSLGRQQTLSEATQQTIDAEVRRLVQEGYDKAKQILTEKRSQLDMLANGLLEFETLTGEEMKGLLQGKRPVREDTSASSPQPPRGSAVPTTGQKPEPDVDGGVAPQPI
jgi:cell division protease FtsH